MTDIEQKTKERTFKRILEFTILGTSISFSLTLIDAVVFRRLTVFFAFWLCVLMYASMLFNYYLTFKKKIITLKYSIITFFLTSIICLTILIDFAGGFGGSMISVLYVIILCSALLTEARTAVFVSVIIIFMYLSFVIGETFGFLVPLENDIIILKYSKALTDLIAFLIITFLITIISQNTKDSINFYKLRSIRLSSIKKRLEILVKKRTKELRKKSEQLETSNKKLREAEKEISKNYKELQKLDVEKDNFISIAAHELKTPLTAIGGYSQILQNEKVAKNVNKRKRFLVILDRESKRLSELVTEILNLSRIDLGVMRYEVEDIDVYELMKNIEDEFSSKIKEKGLKYEFTLEKNLPKISSDKNKLYEIVTNLLSNAIKYTPKGKVTVSVSRRENNLLFSIADTGIGIARKNYSQIFKRFSQIDSSLKREVEGTGLGLSICKEYVEGLGGRIWFKSRFGKGSTFYVSLPIKKVS
jgi:signal transduction histidine kinase